MAERSTFTNVPLLALVLGPIVVELALAQWAGLPHAAALAPEVTAVPPFALLHDLRWLGVYESSAAVFAVAVAGMLVIRAAFFSAVLSAVAVGELQPWHARLGRAALFALVEALFLWPWAALFVGMAVFPLIYFVFVAFPAAFLVGVLLFPYLLTGRWRQWPSWRQVGLQAASFCVLSFAGGCIDAVPAIAQYPLAIAAGLFSAWAWRTLVVDAEARHHARPVVQPWMPIAATYVGAIVLVGFLGVHFTEEARPSLPHVQLAAGHPLLWAPGFDSEWTSGPEDELGKGTVRFSYRGLAPDGHPLHYTRTDTYRSIFELAALMKAQVDRIHAATGSAVDLIADSEGAFVAQTYLLGEPRPPIHRVILSSPLLLSARAYYPPQGAAGRGAVAGATLAGVLTLFRAVWNVRLNRDLPFFRSVVDHAPLVRNYLGCRAPAADDETILLPISATVGEPLGLRTTNPIFIEPSLHGSLIRSEGGLETMHRLLEGRTPRHRTLWRVVGWIGRAAGSAWEAPPLRLAAVAPWRRDLSVVGAGDEPRLSCGQIQTLARALLSSDAGRQPEGSHPDVR